jgi:hypothetical protein
MKGALGDGTSYQGDMAFPDIYFGTGPDRVIAVRGQTQGTITLEVTVVEFNPTEVNVQQGTFAIGSGSTSTTAAITAITPTREWMTAYYKSSSTVQTVPTVFAVRFSRSSTVQLTFQRAGSGTAVDGHWYVVEAKTADLWETRYVICDTSGATDTTPIGMTVDQSKTALIPCSFYCTYTGDEAGSFQGQVFFLDNSTLQADRGSSNGYWQVGTYVVEFLDGTTVQHGLFQFTGTDAQESTAITEVDTTISVPMSSSYLGKGDCAAAGSKKDYAQITTKFINNGQDIQGDRTTYGDSIALDVWWQVIEFKTDTYYFDGYVEEYGTGVDRTVRAHRRDTGELVGETTSSGVDGYFFLETLYSGTQYIICLDDLAGESFNAIIYDLMVPTVSG